MKNANDPIIFHIDVNSAFLSWTALDELEHGSDVDLREIPSIIGGDTASRHGVVLAKSIPAKAYKIRTGEPVVSALRKCPGLVMHRPDHSLYRKRSQELMDYLSGVCPEIEQVSIDECYMDFSPIRACYPDPVAAAVLIKDTVASRFGFTVNVGISDRKILAKMASDFEKPNKVHTLFSWEIREKMWPLPVSDLFSCGKSSAAVLKKLEIMTIGDLANANPSILELHLKSHGRQLWNYANGIDNSTVTALPEDAKGVGNSATYSRDITTLTDAKRELLALCESVSGRLRRMNRKANMVSVEIRYADFKNVSHQTTLPSAVDNADLLYQTVCLLFSDLWNGAPIRLLGVRTSKLVADSEPEQLDLFTYLSQKEDTAVRASSPSVEKLQKLDSCLDQIRKRYGASSVTRGSLLPPKKKL